MYLYFCSRERNVLRRNILRCIGINCIRLVGFFSRSITGKKLFSAYWVINVFNQHQTRLKRMENRWW